MKRIKCNRIYHLVGCLALSLLFGCQNFQASPAGELALQEGDFLGLWDAYNFCMVGRDISQLQANLTVLEAAPKPISLHESPIPIPSFIKELTSSRSSRLAVDPRAMAASCSIHLANVAQQTQNFEAAYRVLENMAANYPEPQYAFYVAKAHDTLEHLNSSFRSISLSSQEAFGR